ncbi:MAG: response regulator [Desulfobulbaceae bacterium]|nr:response regulator [Desulfobulbaceae bacterium]
MSRLLLVEKNIFIRDALREIVHCRFPSLIVKEVLCHENCLSEMGDFTPDVLILGATGNNRKDMEDLQKIRGSFPATVIVFFTAYENEEYRKEGILKGANHIISKELWTGNEILALIKTILATKESWDREYAQDKLIEEEFLHRPIERRRRDRGGRAKEREYLEQNPDRRG